MGVDQLWRQQALGWGREVKKAREKEMKSVVEIRLLAPLFPGFEVCAVTRKGSVGSNGAWYDTHLQWLSVESAPVCI
jgi:hypothetical protein